ncbi:hypothetical protein D3C78_1246510 [compost metagenome]
MARRRPLSFQAWVIGLIGTIVTGLIMYYGRLAIIENMSQRQVAHAQAALQQLQQQNTQRQHQLQSSQRAQRQQDDYDAQVMKAAAESQRQHDAAWEAFYKQPRGCDNWQSDSHMVECQNDRLRAKREFEQKWAAGQIDQPEG